MATRTLQLAPATNKVPTDQDAIRSLKEARFLNYNKYNDRMANGSSATYDGYTFKTDWNGGTNYMRVDPKNIFSPNHSDGLRFYTSEKIGKDRELWWQYWATDKNCFLKNCVGYSGLWRHTNPQFHPRLDMVVFHYCDSSGNPTVSYKVDQLFHSWNSNSWKWAYGVTGQHTSGVDWYIAYRLPDSKMSTVLNGDHRLMGMSMDIDFRTAGTQAVCDGTFWHWKPIISDGTTPTTTNASNCETGSRMVLPTMDNTYPVGDKSKIKIY